MTLIQWYPGHMAKAVREIRVCLSSISLVVELCDARMPLSSRNPLIHDLLKDKKHMTILTKSDKADPLLTSQWLSILSKSNDCIAFDVHRSSIKRLVKRFAKHLKSAKAKTVLITGTPNVGKSSLINRLAGKKIAKVQDKPGITRSQQWTNIGDGIYLMDTPGLLWPKFDDQRVGKHLALCGAVKSSLLNHEELALFLLNFLLQYYPSSLKRYGMVFSNDEDMPSIDSRKYLYEIGRFRGFLEKGSEVDLDRTSMMLIREFQEGILGPITLDQFDK